MGKAYKLDSKKKDKWLEIYKETASFTKSCLSLRISRQAVYNVLEKDKNFAEKKDEIDNLITDVVESRLFALTKTNVVACFFWLTNRRKNKWKNLQRMEHGGIDDKPIKIIYGDAENSKGKGHKSIPRKQKH